MLRRYALFLVLQLFSTVAAIAQATESCLPPADNDYNGTVQFNYGFLNNAFSSNFRTSASVGQTAIETSLSQTNLTVTGYWSQLLVPPLPPAVSASQGDYLDRIEVRWQPNPLGAPATVGYKLYRDGVYQAILDGQTYNYNDYNAIAGRAYRYTVRAVNEFGDGCPTEAVGFMVPNGTVTGFATSGSSRPVSNVLVSLMPLQGYSLVFGASQPGNAHGGAVAVGTTPFFPASGTQDFSLTLWVKNQGNFEGVITEFEGYPLRLQGYADGVQLFVNNIAVGPRVTFPTGTTTAWHHLAITHSSQVFRLYLDGNLQVLANANLSPAPSTRFYLGSKDMATTGWRGHIDELRIYHRRLNEIDLREVIAGTASSTTPGLQYYWKFDEQLGDKSFDIVNRTKMFFCGAYFSTAAVSNGARTDIPMVCTSARTDESGFFTIESAAYGTGTTFIARPSKLFYLNWALQMTRAKKSYAVLPDFALPPQATLELTIYSDGPDPSGTQTLVSKWWGSNRFTLSLQQNTSNAALNDLVLNINGSSGQGNTVGTIGTGYTHVALTIDSSSATTRTIKTYINGVETSSNVFSGVSGDWSDADTRWVIGADRASTGAYSSSANLKDFFTGLVDEFVVYNSVLPLLTIQNHHLAARDMSESGLMVYFPFDEGDGNRLNNCGSLPLGFGEAYSVDWSNYAKFPKTTPHEFTPSSRQVTLNPSVTSVDQVDYLDISTIPVTGFVRYRNTDCFAANIEITNDGTPFNPAVLTDSVGKFTLDAEPGKSYKLKPVFEDHQFVPAFWEVTKVTTPIAGIVFNDITARNVTVTIAGGDCKLSTLGNNLGTPYNSLKLQIRTADSDCFERYATLTDGIRYTFTNVPPFRQLNVGLFSHENNEIKEAIQALGAITVDITERDTAVEFIYRNPNPEVEIYEGLAETCAELKYWSPALPAGATAEATQVRRWSPPLPLGAAPDYTNNKVRFNNTDYPITNSTVTINNTAYTYSAHPINTNTGTVTLSGILHTLTASEAKIVLDKNNQETVKMRVREQYPGGTCVLNEADLRFVNTIAGEVKDTSLTAALFSQSGTVTDAQGNPLTNRTIRVRLTLQPTILASESLAYYREVHTVTTNGSGSFTVLLSQGARDTTVGTPYSEVPWYPAADAPFLKVETDNNLNHTYSPNGAIVKITRPVTSHTYRFRVGDANPVEPYYKSLQVIATTADGRQGTISRNAVVTGTRPNGDRFTTYLPERPTLILRDPPGDESFAYLAKDSTHCTEYAFAFETGQSLTFGVEVDASPTFKQIIGTPVAGTEVDGEGGVNYGVYVTAAFAQTKENGWQECMTFSNTIATNAADVIVGGEQGADVYVGKAQNIIFGTSDRLQVSNCIIAADQVITVRPGTPTFFNYSEYYLKRYLIPYLETLAIFYDGSGKTDSAAIMRRSVTDWKSYIALNASTKTTARFERNLSFDAGVSLEYSTTTSRSDFEITDLGFSQELKISLQAFTNIAGVGTGTTTEPVITFSEIVHNGSNTDKGTTVGYALSDDDVGDAYTVNVLQDPVFKTPVFKILSGQSSCPHEPGTAHRDKTVLEPLAGYPLQAINVPSKEAAVFKFNLGSNSQTYETRNYTLGQDFGANPDGAVINLNGGILNSVDFGVPSNQSVPVTVTVARGPEKYTYENLVLEFFAACEIDRSDALGLDPNTSSKFTYIDTLAYSSKSINVSFVRPCSEVDIDYPRPNYVVLREDPALTPVNSTVRDIIVNNYATTDANFQAIRVQYRRADGNGIWTNILGPASSTFSNPHERWNPNHADYTGWSGSPPPDTLRPISTVFEWETAGLVDATYELRAISVCSGPASGMEGTSYYIPLRIDRDPPKIIAFEPSDGVLHPGDEISVTFDKALNTGLFAPPTGNPLGKVDLFDTAPLAGSGLVDATVTAYENKIYVYPNVLNKFIENKILRLELKNLEDLVGNNTGNVPARWLGKLPEFYVNRNELAWLADSVGLTKPVNTTRSITAKVQNRGGYPVPFEILNYPAYVHVVPNTGTLAPNEIKDITLTVDSSLAFGYWKDSITLRTKPGVGPPLAYMGGDERIPLGVRVTCRPPDWQLDPGAFDGSMNLVLKLNVQGTSSNDVEDIVGAFIDGQLRGRANVQFIPQVSTPTNKVYLAYLTVYGSATDNNKPINIQIWDASACLLYGTISETYAFQSDGISGDANSPATATTNSFVLRKIPIKTGWNWISFNLGFPNPAVTPALSSLKFPANDLIKSQTQNASFFSNGWYGSLTSLDNRKMYMYRADRADTLTMLGMCLPDTMSIYVKTGWNWIGFLPSFALPVNTALSNLKDDGWIQPGDLIKSRTNFAQYIANPLFTGWVGNLEYMMPPNGYQLKLTKSGISNAKLIYPPPAFTPKHPPTSDRGETLPGFWTVDPSLFESNATLIGMMQANNANITHAAMEIGAFSNNEIRGAAQAIYIEPLEAYLFFLTYFANSNGDLMSFKLFDGNTGYVHNLIETLFFSADNHSGSIQSPMPFTYDGISQTEQPLLLNNLEIQPNPFTSNTEIRFTIPEVSEVTISVTDLNGREVSQFTGGANAGLNVIEWQGVTTAGNLLPSGIYFVKLQSPSGIGIRKILIQR